MGYTNYWSLKTNKFPKEFLDDVRKIIDASIVDIVSYSGEEGTEPIIEENEIALNGKEPEAYESFVMDAERGFNFCKTARMPYDQVVKAILIIAEGYGIVEDFHFDGDTTEQEYIMAKMLIKKAGVEVKERQVETDDRIKSILEDNGFCVTKNGDGCCQYEISQYTPEGEDWVFYLENLEEVTEYAEDFDINNEFRILFNSGLRGVPEPLELLKDQEWKKELLMKVKNEVEEI